MPSTAPTTAPGLGAVTDVVEAAAAHLSARFPAVHGLRTRQDVVDAIAAADAASLSVLRPGLIALDPTIGWVEDELDDGPLPAGRWWVADPVEGAINHVHGIEEWGVTATLVEDGAAVLTVVHVPSSGRTWTATVGGGAHLDGEPLRVSGKVELAGALVGTGQASPRETAATQELLARSAAAMMGASGVLRVSVPPTLQLLLVAEGRMDVFWQHSAVRSGLLAGALLVSEAGGLVSDLRGEPWSLGSRDFLAAAPGVQRAAVTVLAPTA